VATPATSCSWLLHLPPVWYIFFKKTSEVSFTVEDIQRIEQRADFFDIVAAPRTPKSAAHSDGCMKQGTSLVSTLVTRVERQGHHLCVAAAVCAICVAGVRTRHFQTTSQDILKLVDILKKSAIPY